MDAETLKTLREKEADGTITEDEYVALLRETDGEDEGQARRMFRTYYGPSQTEGFGQTWVS